MILNKQFLGFLFLASIILQNNIYAMECKAKSGENAQKSNSKESQELYDDFFMPRKKTKKKEKQRELSCIEEDDFEIIGKGEPDNGQSFFPQSAPIEIPTTKRWAPILHEPIDLPDNPFRTPDPEEYGIFEGQNEFLALIESQQHRLKRKPKFEEETSKKTTHKSKSLGAANGFLLKLAVANSRKKKP